MAIAVRRLVAGGYLALSALLLLVSAAPDAQPAKQQGGSTQQDTATSVLAEFEVFRQDLGAFRRAMGEPGVGDSDLGIWSGDPRDIYFQTLTLYERTARLLFEITRVRETVPPLPTGPVGFSDALTLTTSAYGVLKRVMQELNVPGVERSSWSLPPPFRGDIFKTVLSLDRQVNALLERPLNYSDVYMEVNRAVGYSARLLAHFPGAVQVPEEPPFTPGKQPGDVYARLLACLDILARIFDVLGVNQHAVETKPANIGSLAPVDVFMVATLVVSQLDFLHKHLGVIKMPRDVFYPGRKFPAHVYQRVGLLQAQLEQLARLIPIQVDSSPRSADSTNR